MHISRSSKHFYVLNVVNTNIGKHLNFLSKMFEFVQA